VPVKEDTQVLKLVANISKRNLPKKSRGEQFFFVNNKRFNKKPLYLITPYWALFDRTYKKENQIRAIFLLFKR